MSATADYAARFEAYREQQVRIYGGLPGDSALFGEADQRIRDLRSPTRELQEIGTFLRPSDVVVEVHGRSGRIALPLAPLCAEVVNVEPSPQLRSQFEQAAAAQGVTNAQVVASTWMDAVGVEGDVVVAVESAYSLADPVGFLRKLDAAARRRAWLSVRDRGLIPSVVFEEVYGEPPVQALCGRELMPVIWETGLTPEVLPFPYELRAELSARRADVVDALATMVSRPRSPHTTTEIFERAQRSVDRHFDELARITDVGVEFLYLRGLQELYVTWSTEGPEVPLV